MIKQTRKQQSRKQEVEITPEIEAYRKLKLRDREIDSEINWIYANLSIGIREKQKQQMQQIEALKQEREDLVLKTYVAAVEAFRSTESPDRMMALDLIKYANACLKGNRLSFSC